MHGDETRVNPVINFERQLHALRQRLRHPSPSGLAVHPLGELSSQADAMGVPPTEAVEHDRNRLRSRA